MTRNSLAALLAAPLLLAIPTQSNADSGGPCFGHFGCPTCVSWFTKLHQHGPLFNYGPYYGYPPFEPYGPWNAYLQYNPWYNGQGGYGGHAKHHFWHAGGHSCGIGGCGWHAPWKAGGWFKGSGCLTCGHGHVQHHHQWFWQCHKHSTSSCGAAPAAGCSSCKAVAFDPETTDATTRLVGAGSAVEVSSVYFAGLPSIDPEAPGSIIPAGK